MQLEHQGEEINEASMESLDALIQREGALEPTRAMNIFLQIAEILAAAHKDGLVYRELKPSSILVASDGTMEAATLVEPDTARGGGSSTESGRFRAARAYAQDPQYLSPEQCQGDPGDAKSDIYAFGCVMFEALSGRPPFIAENSADVVRQQINDSPPRISSLTPSRVPPLLQAVIETALKKRPEERYESIEELKEDLSAGLEQAKAQQKPSRPTARPAAQPQPLSQREPMPETPPREARTPKEPREPREPRAYGVAKNSAMRGGGGFRLPMELMQAINLSSLTSGLSELPLKPILIGAGGLVVVGIIAAVIMMWPKSAENPAAKTSAGLPSELQVYSDKDATYFEPALQGDLAKLKMDAKYSFKPHSGPTCCRVAYKPSKRDSKDAKRYGAVHWVHPAKNFGTEEAQSSEAYDLSQYSRLTVWARSDSPAKVSLQVGGIKAPYGDSLESGAKVQQKLGSSWRKYTIELEKHKDKLNHMISGFSCIISAKDNPKGAAVYFDDIRFEE